MTQNAGNLTKQPTKQKETTDLVYSRAKKPKIQNKNEAILYLVAEAAGVIKKRIEKTKNENLNTKQSKKTGTKKSFDRITSTPTLKLIDNLTLEAKKLEKVRNEIQLDHDRIDNKISRNKTEIQLNEQLKKSKDLTNEVNNDISSKIKNKAPLNDIEKEMFDKWKQKQDIYTKLLLPKSKKLEKFGNYSKAIYSENKKENNAIYNLEKKTLEQESKILQKEKIKLPSTKQHDELLKGIKDNLKNINKNVLGKEVKDQNILIKIISAIKEYVKTTSPKALEKIRSVLPKSESLSTNVSVKNIKKQSQDKINTHKPKGVRR